MSGQQPSVSENSAPAGVGGPHRIKCSSWGFWQGLGLLVVSLCCCAAALIAVCVHQVAAFLGSRENAQLIVVGLAIAVMNFSFRSELQSLILVMEARFGQSTLQNYEAILCNRVFVDKAQFRVRILMAISTVFPLGLSVAYKRFNGGTTLQHLPVYDSSAYVLQNPLDDTRVTALMIYASQYVMGFDINRPLPVRAYGLNMVTLPGAVTAMLDPPSPAYIFNLQQSLFPGQTYDVAASVNYTFSSINCTNADSSCWMPEGFFASPHAWASTLNVSGMIKFTIAANDAHQEVLFVSAYDELADPPTNFTSNLISFNVYRGNCTGLWQIDESSASLQKADNCSQSEFPSSQDVIRKNKTFRSLQNNLQQVLADAMIEVVNGPPLQIFPKGMSIQSAIIASLIWSKSSIDATDLALFLKYSELISCCFGLTSFLAGITPESITLLRGATYSGSLIKPVKVTMQVVDDGEIDGHPSGHLE
ncbi:hypothetical protein EYC80_001157 [Monilinia laxa]|uniref:Uncharacterized protein n=1 Tax=Monilinia laxa TaxID=61186 RepID=A0A5N6K8H4_MONLA|nr:hypothetical protein EYC80_001157 [Monilinia laxa]